MSDSVARTSAPPPVILIGVWIVVAWGALSFGGVYPWAYWPLLAMCSAIGLSAWSRTRGHGAPLTNPGLAFICVVAAVFLQLVPVPRETLNIVSPAAGQLLQQTDLRFAAAGRDVMHPISIDPGATVRGLAFLVAFGVFVYGLAGSLASARVGSLIAAFTGLGTVVAMAAIVQKAMGTDLIYGFWRPTFSGALYGPFVNRNHFGGWMVMMVPLSLSYAWGLFAGAASGQPDRSWRRRGLWLASREGNQAMFAAFACVVMALSLGLSLSRSGIVCGAAALIVLAAALSRRSGRTPKVLLAALVTTLFAVAVYGGGLVKLGQRFDELAGAPLGDRLGSWEDAIGVARAFPATGTGFNTYGTAMLVYQHYDPSRHYAEAHNDYLQLIAEGGLLVALPVALTMLFIAIAVRRRLREEKENRTDWSIRMGALAGLIGLGCQEVADFSLQIPGNAVLFCVLLALALRSPRRPGQRSSKPVLMPSISLQA